MSSLTYVHILYKSTNINTKYCCQNTQSYMRTYPLLQHEYKHECLFPDFPFIHEYILFTIT